MSQAAEDPLKNAIVRQPQPELIPSRLWKEAGHAADAAAARNVFQRYQRRKAENTLRRQAGDLAVFAEFLSSTGLEPGDFQNDPEAWRYITWGMLDAFVAWQLGQGYAIGSINVRLSTVRRYAGLALQAGTLPPETYAFITQIKGYGHQEGLHEDQKRQMKDVSIRRGSKKAQPVLITHLQAEKLMAQPETPLGQRDALLMCILLEEGLRIGEVVLLTGKDFDLDHGELRFYRPKVDREQRLEISEKTVAAARAYLENDAPKEGTIWRAGASARDGKAAVSASRLTGPGMSERTLTRRVAQLGARFGLKGLSAHDCRHYWASQAAKNQTPLPELQDAGGWNSVAMPMRYIEKSQVASVRRRKE
jgi:integrase